MHSFRDSKLTDRRCWSDHKSENILREHNLCIPFPTDSNSLSSRCHTLTSPAENPEIIIFQRDVHRSAHWCAYATYFMFLKKVSVGACGRCICTDQTEFQNDYLLFQLCSLIFQPCHKMTLSRPAEMATSRHYQPSYPILRLPLPTASYSTCSKAQHLVGETRSFDIS